MSPVTDSGLPRLLEEWIRQELTAVYYLGRWAERFEKDMPEISRALGLAWKFDSVTLLTLDAVLDAVVEKIKAKKILP